MMPKIIFFGSSRFSELVLKELEKAGIFPILKITNAKLPLPSLEEIKKVNPDLIIVASFGKILPISILELPKYKSLNLHPSLLPELRGPAPIQGTIMGDGKLGISIIRMDEKMDHGPLVAQREVTLNPWPDFYEVVEEKLAKIGGELLAKTIPKWIDGTAPEKTQDDNSATYIKMIKKEDGLISLDEDPYKNMRKIMAYSSWPGTYFYFNKKNGENIRVIIKKAKIENGRLVLEKIIPAGKKEMDWEAFLRGNS